jgi:hypothetical protein
LDLLVLVVLLDLQGLVDLSRLLDLLVLVVLERLLGLLDLGHPLVLVDQEDPAKC